MLEKQQENEKPRSDRTPLQGQQDEKRKFEDIEEASEFWRALWEGTGSGNAGMEWIEDVREAMKEAIPEIPTTACGENLRNSGGLNSFLLPYPIPIRFRLSVNPTTGTSRRTSLRKPTRAEQNSLVLILPEVLSTRNVI